jgi:hypothetical protein
MITISYITTVYCPSTDVDSMNKVRMSRGAGILIQKSLSSRDKIYTSIISLGGNYD